MSEVHPYTDHKVTKTSLLENLDEKWFLLIPNLREKAYWDDIVTGINKTIDKNMIIVPNVSMIFRALNTFNPSNFKVLLIGQDPYPTIGNAMGYSFSVTSGKKVPPSLLNMFKEIDRSYNSNMSVKNVNNGDLTRWSEQGVLLLNSILTIGVSLNKNDKTKTESHATIGWQMFIQDIINYLDTNYKFITLALGSFAQKIAKLIVKNSDKGQIINAPHPSPLNIKYQFYGCNCFENCNDELIKLKLIPIKWDF